MGNPLIKSTHWFDKTRGSFFAQAVIQKEYIR